MAGSIRRTAVSTAAALAFAAVACPVAGAEEQAQATDPVLGSLLQDLIAVPAATLPSVSVTLGPTQPGETARPAESGSATPQAYIKNRVALQDIPRHGALGRPGVRADHSSGPSGDAKSGRVIKRRQAFGLTGAKLHVADTDGDGVRPASRTSSAATRSGCVPRSAAAPCAPPSRSPYADLVDKGQPVHVKRRGRRLR